MRIPPSAVYRTGPDGERLPVSLVHNQFLVLKADQSSRKTQLGRFDGKKIVPLAFKKKKPYGIAPRNVGQTFLQVAFQRSCGRDLQRRDFQFFHQNILLQPAGK